MLRRHIIAALPVLGLAVQAQAAGAPPAKASANPYVDLAPLALPVVVDERVVNYVFVALRVNLTRTADLPKAQAQAPFLRDALVRAAHRTPFTRPDDYLSLDAERLKASLLAEARRLRGKDVHSVAILSQTPQRRSGVPTPPRG